MLLRALAVALLFLTACGGDSTSAPSSSPLSGKIAGKKFKAGGGVATIGMTASDRFIIVGTTKPDCSDPAGAKNGELVVTFDVTWKAGASQAVDAKHEVTLADVPSSVFATSGQIDVISAPTGLNSVGALKLVAADGADNSVDGEVDITVCE